MLVTAIPETSPWLAVFGRAHPILLHAPLGILPAIAVLELGALLLRRELPRGAILVLAWLVAIAAALAAAAGLVLAGEGGYDGEHLGNHKIAGLVFAGLALLAAVCACLPKRGWFRAALLLALLVMLPAGHLGGSLTHGENFLLAPLQRATAEPQGEFAQQIAPILQRSCTRCHNADKRKGELDLSSPDGIRAGGDSGEVVVPGKPEESELLRLCLLPEDDDAVMPPAGKRPRPTAAELARLRQWIVDGANYE